MLKGKLGVKSWLGGRRATERITGLKRQRPRRLKGCAEPAIRMIGQRRLDPSPMLTHRFPLQQIVEGFELVAGYRDGVVKAVIDLSVNLNIEYAKECARHGADFVMTGDDYASTERPLMSPATFRELMFPGVKKVFAAFKEAGLMTIKHTDGNISPLLEMIVDIGMDCLDPIDPISGMDIGDMKRRYGDRFAMKGNVDCAHTLTFGSMDAVVEETKNVIRKAGRGGGLIVSSSNSIHSKVKPQNYLAMVNTIRAYGKYPLRLDQLETSGACPAFG